VAISDSIIVLRRQGWSYRRIAEALDIHRETVARYVRLAEACPPGWAESNPATNLSAGSEAAEGARPAEVTTGDEAVWAPNPAGNLSTGPSVGEGSNPATNLSTGRPGPESLCEPFRDLIEKKRRQGLTAQRIWQDLVREKSSEGRYASVKRAVRRQEKVSGLPFRRVESAPGQEAQIDFGPGGLVTLPSCRRKRYPVLRLVLSYSRKGYSESLPRQSTEDFIRALENAFRAFGGAPRTLMPDQLKAAVARADWYDPLLNPKVEAFCRHYGTVMLPARPYTPRHKGNVEAGVRCVYNNGLKGEVFESITAENMHLQHWEAHVADLRIHGTTKKQVKALFEEGRPALLPLCRPRHFLSSTRRSAASTGTPTSRWTGPTTRCRRSIWAARSGRAGTPRWCASSMGAWSSSPRT